MSVRASLMPSALAFAAFAACVAGSATIDTALGDSAEKGKAAFVQHGCWQCHGFNGQRTVTSNGRVLARTALPADAFKSFVRSTNGAIPPFRPAVISDEALDDIYAYLQTMPPPKSPANIPLLNEMPSR
jgi:ubiquinol-cytochrome c reductase cytochrome c subunit